MHDNQGRVQRRGQGVMAPPNRGIVMLHHLFTHKRVPKLTHTHTHCVYVSVCARV